MKADNFSIHRCTVTATLRKDISEGAGVSQFALRCVALKAGRYRVDTKLSETPYFCAKCCVSISFDKTVWGVESTRIAFAR